MAFHPLLAVLLSTFLFVMATADSSPSSHLRNRGLWAHGEEEEEARDSHPHHHQGAGGGGEVWYDVDHPERLNGGGSSFTMTVKPFEENVKVQSKAMYTAGKFEVEMKSAAAMPGVVTAIYLASGDGRTGDSSLGSQDEIDFEFKGNAPSMVQSNVFLDGQEDLQLISVGDDTSKSAHRYGVEWSSSAVDFFIDGRVVRTKQLSRPLKPLRLAMSLWTTSGGWPGLKMWAGETNWETRGNQPVTASFDIISLPQQQ